MSAIPQMLEQKRSAQPAERVPALALLNDPRQLDFFQEHLDRALQLAERFALSRGSVGRSGIACGVVEMAAEEALAKVALTVTQPGFDEKKVAGRLITYVRHAVTNILNTVFGWRYYKLARQLPRDADPDLLAGREPEPGDQFLPEDRPDWHEHWLELLTDVTRLTGGLAPETGREWLELARLVGLNGMALREKYADQPGVKKSYKLKKLPKDELAELVADHIRELLATESFPERRQPSRSHRRSKTAGRKRGRRLQLCG
jgi:hypothetical protein